MSDVTMTAIEAAYRTAVAVKLSEYAGQAVHDYRSDDVCPECRRTDCEGDCGASRKPIDVVDDNGEVTQMAQAGRETKMEKFDSKVSICSGCGLNSENKEDIRKTCAEYRKPVCRWHKAPEGKEVQMSVQDQTKKTIAIPAGQAPATPFVRKPRKQYKGATPVDGRTLNGKIDKVVAKSTNMVTIVKGAERVDRFCPDVLAFLADAKAKGVPTFSAKFADGTPVVERLQANS